MPKRLKERKYITITIKLLISLILLIFISSCSDDDNNGGIFSQLDNNNTNNTNNNSQTVTLSGTIYASPNNLVDSDVNDPYQPYVSNDSIAASQSITNPVTLGGYVNVPGSGAEGRSYSNGDVYDYFEVYLSDGDSIYLSISDHDSMNPYAVDIDLYIKDSNGDVIASSVGTGNSEYINDFHAVSGIYYVEVLTLAGASNYTLSIGALSQVVGVGALSSDMEFVTGEAVVRFKEQEKTITSIKGISERVSSMGMSFDAGGPGREMLVSFKDLSENTALLQSLGVSKERTSLRAVDEKAQEKLDTLNVIKALRKRLDILSADPNYIRHTMLLPDDEHYDLQWNLPLISLPEAWDITMGSSDVIVAVLDTGVLLNHPDLTGKFTDDGYDFISDSGMSNDGDGIDDNPDDPGDEAYGGSSSFHGTHVAGIISALTDNNKGVAGVSWSTSIMPVRALGIGGGTSYDILQGARYAAGLPNDSETVPVNPADIINMSFGGTGFSSAEQAVYDAVRDEGVILIAAAGNESSSIPYYPASYEGVVSVSAVDINGDQASYSNYGVNIDVAAPGGDYGDLNGDGFPDYVLSTCGDDSSGTIKFAYVFMAGTSMTASHVSGIVALMKAMNSDLTPDNLDQYLINGDITYDYGDTGWDEDYGYGLIDAYKAVTAVDQGGIQTVLKVSPPGLNFGQSTETATLSASKLGSEDLIVDEVSDNADWLTIEETSVDPTNGLGTYTVQVDRSGVSQDGNYSATITFTSNFNTVNVPVRVQVNTTVATPDNGTHYVLLVDPDTQETLYMLMVQVEDGVYNYSFIDVPQGEYEIFAGSDRDNDMIVGDEGEAFGAYASVDQPVDIFVDKDMTGLDFSTSYFVTMPATTAHNEKGRPLFLRKSEMPSKKLDLVSP